MTSEQEKVERKSIALWIGDLKTQYSTELVLATDYDALAAERDRLQREVEQYKARLCDCPHCGKPLDYEAAVAPPHAEAAPPPASGEGATEP